VSRPRTVEVPELRALIATGMTSDEIAETLGVTRRTVQRYKKRYGLIEREKKLPWTLAREHQESTPHQYLRALENGAQGKYEDQLPSAQTWAKGIVEKGKDVGYNEDHEGTELSHAGGFYLKDPQGEYYLKNLLARSYATPQR